MCGAVSCNDDCSDERGHAGGVTRCYLIVVCGSHGVCWEMEFLVTSGTGVTRCGNFA